MAKTEVTRRLKWAVSWLILGIAWTGISTYTELTDGSSFVDWVGPILMFIAAAACFVAAWLSNHKTA